MMRLDAQGAPIGKRLLVSRHTRFDEGSIPSWVTPDASVAGSATEGATYTLQPGLSGGLLLTMPGINNRRARIYGPEIDLTKFSAARIRVRALLERAAGSDFYGTVALGFADDASVRGAQAGCFINNNATLAQMSLRKASTGYYVNTQMPDLRGGKWQDISLWIDCGTKDVLVGVGTQVQALWPAADQYLELGPVKPRFGISTHGPVKSALVTEFEFQAWQ